jgi:hypothetical protein
MPAIKRKRQAVSAKSKAKVTKKAAVLPKKKTPAAKKVAAKPKKRDVKAAQKSAAKNTKKVPQSDSDSEEVIVERETTMSNGVMVDHLVPNANNYTVVKYNGVVLNMHLMFAD